MAEFGLSKSKIITGLQCPKRLYLEVHQPDLAAKSGDVERAFSNGHLVGNIARQYLPTGKLIGFTSDLREALTQTETELRGRGNAILFEAAFQHGGVLVRADIFSRTSKKHHVVEVKSSTSVKDYHLQDAAIQYFVINRAGYSVDSISIAHIDSTFVYQGAGDYRELLTQVIVTDEITGLVKEVPAWIKEFKNMLAGELPAIDVGQQCHDPFDCPFYGHCNTGQPEYPVSILPRGGKVAERLRTEGYRDLREVPLSILHNPTHRRVWNATQKGKPDLDMNVRKKIQSLPYPRFYLDFETIQFAVPIWVGTRPYEQLPFQWSCHVEREGGELSHQEFLDTTGNAPMRSFAESLVRALGNRGPVLTYSYFERTVLKSLADRYPDLDVPLTKIIKRITNLLPITQEHYYHPEMKGSWSLKAVLPTIAPDIKYEDLESVQDGREAQSAFHEILDPNTGEERRETLSKDLKIYCMTDTLAMVRLTRFLAGT